MAVRTPACTFKPPRDVLGRRLCADPACRAILRQRPGEKNSAYRDRRICGTQCNSGYQKMLWHPEREYLNPDGIVDEVAIKRNLDGHQCPMSALEWDILDHMVKTGVNIDVATTQVISQNPKA